MKKLLLLSITLCLGSMGFSQITAPKNYSTGNAPDLSTPFKAPGDSCGTYWNNYIALGKTTQIYYEDMRAGTPSVSGTYGGRSQRFHANQPIEISGIQFYAFETNPSVDSLMAITVLHDYTASNDSVGVELARDTVYVTRQSYTISLPLMEVNSVFDNPVTVTSDYMLTVYTPEDDSIKIISSSAPGNDGNAEGVSYFYYNNPNYLSFEGYYNVYANLGASYDLDYLISPRVKFDLHDEFTILDDEICPDVIGAGCVEYTQKPNFNDPHYNWDATTATDNIKWLWGDGFQNTDITSACHTYDTSGVYDITLYDTLRRYVFSSTNCPLELVDQITVIDSVSIDFSYINNDTWVTFTNNSSNADSVYWDLGDSTFTSDWDPFHMYDSVGTYSVTLYAYNECFMDSATMDVTVDNLSVGENNLNFEVYPNPANDLVVIKGLKNSGQIEIINILGETVRRFSANSTSEQIQVSDLSSGTYFVRVTTDHNQLTKKLVIKH
ncbi:MAG: T9SS type A sorting domain-containing protein [Crocinitomicaceae bacterium]